MDPLRRIAHIRRQRDKCAQLDTDLEAAVVAAFHEGHTGPEIAAVAGLSKQRVYQIRDGTR